MIQCAAITNPTPAPFQGAQVSRMDCPCEALHLGQMPKADSDVCQWRKEAACVLYCVCVYLWPMVAELASKHFPFLLCFESTDKPVVLTIVCDFPDPLGYDGCAAPKMVFFPVYDLGHIQNP